MKLETLKAWICAVLFAALPTASYCQTDLIRITASDHVIDLTGKTWNYVAFKPAEKPAYEEVIKRRDWKKIKVGQRWEVLGHPELADQTVWVRIRFMAPEQLSKFRFGFFASMIDDQGTIYINGKSAGNFKYLTGGKIPHPVNVDLTAYIEWNKENTLLIEVRDAVTQRIGGIVGSACLYKTLENSITPQGGIEVNTDSDAPLAVLLHLADAQLLKGEKKTFSTTELRDMKTPPSILREDELIIVTPAASVPEKKYLPVDLNNVAPVVSAEQLQLSAGSLPSQVRLYDQLKIPVNVSATFNNPFDPREISVYAVIKTPDGRIEKVEAFFGQDFEPVSVYEEEEILIPIKGNPWKLFYRPRQKGAHQVEIFAQDKNAMKRVVAGEFEAVASDARGYLQPSKVDPRFYEFDNGEPYYGRGPSGWYRGSRYLFGGNIRWVPVKILDDFYARKKANGSNFEYLATFHFGSLYIKDGYIDQHVAWKLEHALRSMEANGLYWIVFHDGVLRSYQNGFDTLPFSEAQGGPSKNINEVYTNPVALEMQKNELRYMVSRWADSPSLWIWNCGDESQPGTQYSRLMVRNWLKELHSYIRQTDIYRHGHSVGEYEEAILNGGDMVLLGDWYYHNNNRGDKYDQLCNGEKSQDAIEYNLCLQADFQHLDYPVVNIEGGTCQWKDYTWLSGKYLAEFPEQIDFHQHLWLSFFTKMAAGGTEWLCQIVDQKGELYHARAMENYLAGEPFTRVNYAMLQPAVDNPGLRSFALKSDDRTLVWVHNNFYSWYNIGVQKKKPVPVNRATIRIPVAKDGAYNVELWDTRKGTVISSTSTAAVKGEISLTLPSIDKDVALKAIYKQQ